MKKISTKKSGLILTALVSLVSTSAHAYVTCVPAEKDSAENLTCVHLAQTSQKNTIERLPIYVQTKDKKIIKGSAQYYTDGNASHVLISSTARGFQVDINFDGAKWDATKGMQPSSKLSVQNSQSGYVGNLYCSSKLTMKFIRDNCPNLSAADELKLAKDLNKF